MNHSEENRVSSLFTPHNRRDFIKRAGALGLSAGAFSAFLEACGSTTPTTTGASSVNMAGPIDMSTLISKAKTEGKLQAIGIPPEWADYPVILPAYATKFYTVDHT